MHHADNRSKVQGEAALTPAKITSGQRGVHNSPSPPHLHHRRSAGRIWRSSLSQAANLSLISSYGPSFERECWPDKGVLEVSICGAPRPSFRAGCGMVTLFRIRERVFQGRGPRVSYNVSRVSHFCEGLDLDLESLLFENGMVERGMG